MIFSNRYTEGTEVAQRAQRRFEEIDAQMRGERERGNDLESDHWVSQLSVSALCNGLSISGGTFAVDHSTRNGLRRAEALQNTQ